jgi:formylglycine-generating enzyme required for sulfatase activity
MTPARYVDLDDAEAFARWRSARDGVTYRLPTEAEWEYAARNGERGDLYPWGNRWVPSNAVMGVSDSEPSSVGSRPGGQNQWGVMDLIGNVWEWTSTEIAPYPGSDLEVVKDPDERRIVVRGGSAHEDPAKVKVTSTFRVDIPSVQTEKTVGFRLVRPE